MCPECAALKQADTPEQCEANGHEHVLKLNDGMTITFLESPRAATLIRGDGRENANIQVWGFYDKGSRSLDVDTHQIDDAWSAWCDVHDQMDFCRSTGELDSTRDTGSVE